MSKTKVCSMCGKTHPESYYSFRNAALGTRFNYCKDCGRNYGREYYYRKGRRERQIKNGWDTSGIKHAPEIHEIKNDKMRPVYTWTFFGKQYREHVHRVNWRQHFGPIPAGYVIHHIDGDPLNNDISNLQCMPLGEHSRLHNTITFGTCRRCGTTDTHLTKKMCDQCYEYFKINGTQRPLAKPVKPIVLCSCCGRKIAVSKGMCRNCYSAAWMRNKHRKKDAIFCTSKPSNFAGVVG